MYRISDGYAHVYISLHPDYVIALYLSGPHVMGYVPRVLVGFVA
jgi:hypothetical protein